MAKLLTGTRIYGTGTVDTQLFVSGTNSATSTTTGALQVVGGVGIGGNLHVGGIIYGAILGTATTATNADNIKTVLQTASATYYPAFVNSNNSTAAYEALYTTASFSINPITPQIVLSRADSSAQLVLQNTVSTLARYPQVVIQNFDSFGGMGVIELQRGRGNSSIPQSVLSGDLLGGFNTWGHNGGSMISATRINGVADSTFSTTASAYLSFLTTFNSVQTEKVRITAAGNVGIGFNAPNGKLDVAGDLYVGTTQNTARFKSDGTDTFVDAIPGAGAVVIRAGGSVEKLRVTANGGVSFGASGTAYGISGQILQSNGDAAPTWISTGSLAAANATTATHLSGGVAGQIPYQTAPGVTAFLSTGTAGDVLVSNGSGAATYNNTLRLADSTNATSTTSGALQVVGGVGVGGNLFIQGDIRTNDSLFNLINANATIVNFAGDATALTMGASGSGTTNVRNNLTVSGNLTVQGTTTIVDSTVTNIADPILTLGGGTGNTAPTADDNKDRGIAFKWVNNGGTTSTGFFGYDDSTGFLTYIQTATITNEVVSGTKGAADVHLAGGSAMAIVYQSSPNNTGFLAAGTSGYLLQTNGTGSAPSWVNASGVSAGSATYADNVRTIAQAGNAVYYPTFVDSNNATNAYESVYTTSSFSINPQSGNVGIGTSSPAAKIDIGGNPTYESRLIWSRGNNDSDFKAVLASGDAGTTATVGSIGVRYSNFKDFASIQFYRNSSVGNLLFFTGGLSGDGSEQMRLTPTGLGIGTSSPTVPLDVVGAIRAVTASTAANSVRIGNTGNSLFLGVDSSTGGTNIVGSVAYATTLATNTALQLSTNNGASVQATLDSSGNVGIGTQSLGAKLHVSASQDNSILRKEVLRVERVGGAAALAGAGRTSEIAFADASNPTLTASIGGLREAPDGNFNGSLVFYTSITGGAVASAVTSLTERLRITSSGAIAFSGSASYGSSGQVLQSNGNAAPTWVSPSTLASASATNADNIRTVARTTAAAHYLTFVDSNNASNAYEAVYTTSSFVINPSTGYIGMGITSPQRPLHVFTQGTSLQGIAAFEANASGLIIQDNGGQNGNVEIVGYKQTSSTYHSILLRGSGPGLLVQTGTGNVGIGILTPQYTLDVNNGIVSSNSFQASFGSTISAGYWSGIHFGYSESANTLYRKSAIVFERQDSSARGKVHILNNGTNGSASATLADAKVTILYDGNVGIGTQSPGAKLEVAMTRTAATSGIVLYLTDNVTGGQTDGVYKSIRSGSNGGNSISEIRFLETDGSNNNTSIAFATQGTAGGLTERMRVNQSGAIAFGGAANYGASGQVLRSNGNAAPTWINQSSITSGGTSLTNTYVGFGSASNLLTGSANLTYASSILNVAYQNTFDASTPGFGTYGLHFNGQTTADSATGITFSAGAASATNANAGIYSQGSGSYGTKMYFATTDSYAVGSKTRVMIDQAGNVGIGTVNPISKLQVGNNTFSGVNGVYSNARSGLSVNGSLTSIVYASTYNDATYPDYGMVFVHGPTTSNYNVWSISPDGPAKGSGLGFIYGANADNIHVGAPKVYFQGSTGNVGIGTSSPAYKLSVITASDVWHAQFGTSGGKQLRIGGSTTNGSVIGAYNDDNNSSPASLLLQRDGGNVGIGTAAPGSKLSVEGLGTANESVARFNNQGDYASRIWLRNSSRSSYFSVSGSTGDTFATGALPYGLLIGLSGNPSPVQFYNGTSGAVKMTIDTVGNVGIGTTTPTAKFEVAGTAGQLFSVSDSFTGTIFSVNDVSGIPSIEVIDTGLVKFAQYGGQVAINTGTVASSTASLSVYGMIQTMGTLGEIRASSEITAYFSSDRRLKENIKLIENPITIIDQIRGVTFDWTDEHMARRGGEDGYFVRKHDIGVIAQEVQAVLPELVGTREDGYLAVKYEKLVPLLIEAIKSQQKTIETLTSEIKEIKEFLSSLKNN